MLSYCPCKTPFAPQLPTANKRCLRSKVTFYRGKRSFSFFFTDETPSLTVSFRNEFNVSDVLFVDAQTKRKLSFERATALCCDEISFYNDNTEVWYESEAVSLSPTLAQMLTNALLFPFVRIVSRDFPNGGRMC